MALVPRFEFDAAYVDRLTAGDEETERHFTGYFGDLLTLKLRARLRSPALVEDAKQETFLRVHQNLRHYRFECPLRNWIARIAYSIAIRHVSRRRAALGAEMQSDIAELLSDGASEHVDFGADSDAAAEACRLRRAVQSLPPLQRQVLSLYHFDDLSIAEIAQVTGLAPGTIKSHLFRSRLRLKDLLENGDPP